MLPRETTAFNGSIGPWLVFRVLPSSTTRNYCGKIMNKTLQERTVTDFRAKAASHIALLAISINTRTYQRFEWGKDRECEMTTWNPFRSYSTTTVQSICKSAQQRSVSSGCMSSSPKGLKKVSWFSPFSLRINNSRLYFTSFWAVDPNYDRSSAFWLLFCLQPKMMPIVV